MPSPSDTGASRGRLFRTVDMSILMGPPHSHSATDRTVSRTPTIAAAPDQGSGEVAQGRHELPVDNAAVSERGPAGAVFVDRRRMPDPIALRID